jgi:hypothetical protein
MFQRAPYLRIFFSVRLRRAVPVAPTPATSSNAMLVPLLVSLENGASPVQVDIHQHTQRSGEIDLEPEGGGTEDSLPAKRSSDFQLVECSAVFRWDSGLLTTMPQKNLKILNGSKVDAKRSGQNVEELAAFPAEIPARATSDGCEGSVRSLGWV